MGVHVALAASILCFHCTDNNHRTTVILKKMSESDYYNPSPDVSQTAFKFILKGHWISCNHCKE